jgi:hypothetical protein
LARKASGLKPMSVGLKASATFESGPPPFVPPGHRKAGPTNPRTDGNRQHESWRKNKKPTLPDIWHVGFENRRVQLVTYGSTVCQSGQADNSSSNTWSAPKSWSGKGETYAPLRLRKGRAERQPVRAFKNWMIRIGGLDTWVGGETERAAVKPPQHREFEGLRLRRDSQPQLRTG